MIDVYCFWKSGLYTTTSVNVYGDIFRIAASRKRERRNDDTSFLTRFDVHAVNVLSGAA